MTSAPFKYPIRVTYQTQTGERETNGTLVGVWQAPLDALALQPSEEMQAAINASAEAQNLFTNHILSWVDYAGSIEPKASVLTGTFTGEATLLGSTRLGDQRVRYALHVPFAIDEGRFTYLLLTRDKLNDLLHDVLNQPLTRNVLAADPDAILTLLYDEKTSASLPTIEGLLSHYQLQRQITLEPCSELPGAGTYPTDAEPLRAFGFTHTWWSGYDSSVFILVNTKVALLNLSLFAPSNSPLSRILLPSPLQAESLKGVDRIDLVRPGGAWNSGVTIHLPDNADDETVARVKGALPKLPASLDTQSYETIWSAKGVATHVNKDGQLELMTCKP